MTSGLAFPPFRQPHPPERHQMRPSKVPGPKAGPNGSFPIGDAKHARLAIGGATRSYNAGNIGKSTENHIKAEARAELKNAEGNRAVSHFANMQRMGK